MRCPQLEKATFRGSLHNCLRGSNGQTPKDVSVEDFQKSNLPGDSGQVFRMRCRPSPIRATKEERVSCRCTKSKCLKLYCKCYASGIFCDYAICTCNNCANYSGSTEEADHCPSCTCASCRQSKAKEARRVLAMGISRRMCRCKTSKCLQLYCPCFQSGQSCSSQCSCVHCLNHTSGYAENERTIAVSECLSRRRDAFERRPSRGELLRCACRKTRYVDLWSNCFRSSINGRCLRKYCVCYSRGRSCGESCECTSCANTKLFDRT